MYILLDFDGTCVTHDYPKVGKDIGAVPVLKKLIDNGHKLILFTIRDYEKNIKFIGYETIIKSGIECALDWFKSNNIDLFGVNNNRTQDAWSKSRKVYGHMIIDDTALGIPLIYDEKISDRPFVDWNEVEKLLTNMGAIK